MVDYELTGEMRRITQGDPGIPVRSGSVSFSARQTPRGTDQQRLQTKRHRREQNVGMTPVDRAVRRYCWDGRVRTDSTVTLVAESRDCPFTIP